MTSLVAKEVSPPAAPVASTHTRSAARRAVLAVTLLSLPDDVLLRILARLPVKQRLLARAVCVRFRAVAGTPTLYSRLKFPLYGPTVTPGLLVAAMTAAGSALRSLDLRSMACCLLTSHDLLRVLERTPASARASLRIMYTMFMPVEDHRYFEWTEECMDETHDSWYYNEPEEYDEEYEVDGDIVRWAPPKLVLSIDQALKLKKLLPNNLSIGLVVIDACTPVTLLRARLFIAPGVTTVYCVDFDRLSPAGKRQFGVFVARVREASTPRCEVCVWKILRPDSSSIIEHMSSIT